MTGPVWWFVLLGLWAGWFGRGLWETFLDVWEVDE